MKRIGNLFTKVVDKENIRMAIIRASENKRQNKEVQEVLRHMDSYVERVRNQLISHNFKNSKYSTAKIYEPLSKKTREIFKPKFFPDQIVHWSIMLQLQPLIMKGMDPHNCGNIPKRGEQHIRKFLKKIIVGDPRGTKYFLKYDIHQFYPSIDHGILIKKLSKLIKDEELLNLIKEIVEITPSGLPIGTYTSQWLANYYLQDLDHYTREKLNVKYMLRYVDDVVILGPNKRALHKVKRLIEQFMVQSKLSMKSNWIIRELEKQPIDFVGYKFYRNGKITIRHRVWKNARRLILKIQHHGLSFSRAKKFMSYYGYIKNSSSHIIGEKYLSKVSIKNMKMAVSQGGNAHVQIQR